MCNYFIPARRSVRYCDDYVCVFFHLLNTKMTWPNFAKFFVHVACGRGSVLLWWRYDMLCTGGFVNGVMLHTMAMWHVVYS